MKTMFYTNHNTMLLIKTCKTTLNIINLCLKKTPFEIIYWSGFSDMQVTISVVDISFQSYVAQQLVPFKVMHIYSYKYILFEK